MNAIRVAHIDSGAEDAQDGDRLRLELRRRESGELAWYDATTDEWVGGDNGQPHMPTVEKAMQVLYDWYDNFWHLTIGSRES